MPDDYKNNDNNVKPNPVMTTEETFKLPAYISSVYNGLYMKGNLSKYLDSERFAKISTFGQYEKIKQSVLQEVKEMQNVLWVGNSWGNFMQDVARKISIQGSFDVVEAAPKQYSKLKEKLKNCSNAKVFLDDIEFYYPKKSRKRVKYDLVIAYFLLHELPDQKKKRVIESLISLTTRSGKVLFVDYDKPKNFNLLKFPVLWVNRLIEPFAESLMTKGLKTFVQEPEKYIWDKDVFFGNMYQRTTIKRKR